ncbi:hypothetical protein [Streptomyces siamensis]|uniref:Uncharacterized protein n=1 Tax=Streptomyces siamensis TaxID=1274986 RepID=A0ABP9IJE2_9ACTN
MKALFLGAVLGVLLLWPPALSLTAALAAKPVIVAFGLGLAARPAIARRLRRWTT